MKTLLAFLLSTLTAHAASVTVEWTPSTTAGATNTVYLSRAAITNLATAQWRYDVGSRTNVTATLSQGAWFWAVTARTEAESDPSTLMVIVPQPVGALREVVLPSHLSAVPPLARSRQVAKIPIAGAGHDRQRRK